jgi:periplasmic protein CpxP/Spy
MKKIILTLSILGSLVTGVQAQDRTEKPKVNQEMPKGNDVAQKVKQSIESIDKACGGLTEDQKTKISAINTEKFTKIAELQAKVKGGDREAVKKEIETIRDSYKGKIREILTPDQIAKFKENAKMNKKEGGGKGDKNGKGEGKKEGKDKKDKKNKGEKKDSDSGRDAIDDIDKEDLEK